MQAEDHSTLLHDMNQIHRKDWYKSYSVSADYTITDNDKIKDLFVTTGSSTITITLPTAADNLDRMINIWKIDSGSGTVTVDGEGAETINGYATINLFAEFNRISIKCDGSNWLYGWNPTPMVLATSGAVNQNINPTTWTALRLDTETYDDDSEWNTASYRYDPNVDCRVLVMMACFFNQMGDGKTIEFSIQKNGAGNENLIKEQTGNGTNQITVNGHIVIDLLSTDYIKAIVHHNDVAARAVRFDGGRTYINIIRLRLQ